MTNTSDPFALWDAAYVLGSLSAAQRRDYEEHLSGCPACQDQVAELSGLPGLLALTREGEATAPSTAGEVAAVEAVPLYAGLAALVARRRRRLVLAAAAAAIVLAGTTAALTAGLDNGTVSPPSAVSSASASVPLTFTGAASRGLTATGTAASYPWGTQISWRCSYAASTLYRGQSARRDYVLVVVSTSGTDTPVASWSAGPGSVVTPTATVSTPVGSIARLEIRDSTGATLLSAAP